MLSCVIDAMELRDVAIAEITGALLEVYYYKEDIHIKMEG